MRDWQGDADCYAGCPVCQDVRAFALLSATLTPTPIPTPTATPVPTLTPTAAPLAHSDLRRNPKVTPTPEPLAQILAAPTATASPTATPTITPTVTPTITPTLSPLAAFIFHPVQARTTLVYLVDDTGSQKHLRQDLNRIFLKLLDTHETTPHIRLLVLKYGGSYRPTRTPLSTLERDTLGATGRGPYMFSRHFKATHEISDQTVTDAINALTLNRSSEYLYPAIALARDKISWLCSGSSEPWCDTICMGAACVNEIIRVAGTRYYYDLPSCPGPPDKCTGLFGTDIMAELVAFPLGP